MLNRISKEEANTIAAYEPIESEFRTQAYKKWHNIKEGINMYGLRWRVMEPDVGILTLAKNNHVKKMDMIIDYFPLDEVENSLFHGRTHEH
jgi:hypothetical protein